MALSVSVLAELKAAEGWTWEINARTALFGDAVLYRDYTMRVVSKTQA